MIEYSEQFKSHYLPKLMRTIVLAYTNWVRPQHIQAK